MPYPDGIVFFDEEPVEPIGPVGLRRSLAAAPFEGAPSFSPSSEPREKDRPWTRGFTLRPQTPAGVAPLARLTAVSSASRPVFSFRFQHLDSVDSSGCILLLPARPGALRSRIHRAY